MCASKAIPQLNSVHWEKKKKDSKLLIFAGTTTEVAV